jgi:uncharacterized protein with HEPN domain
MSKQTVVYVKDILYAIDKIETSTKDIDFETFRRDYEKVDSVAYNVLIIGEASNKIPLSIRKSYPSVPWRILKDIRNKNIHEYGTVDAEKLWKMAKMSLPKIKPLIDEVLKQTE